MAKLTANALSPGFITVSRKPQAACCVAASEEAIEPEVSISMQTVSGRFCTCSNLTISCFFPDS